jgi:hypothetical protein
LSPGKPGGLPVLPLPAGGEVRIEGNALLRAVRYEVERVRCSRWGQVFTAPWPVEAGEERYTPRARAVLALSGYSLGVPFYRLKGFQALVGVPVAEAMDSGQATPRTGMYTRGLVAHAGAQTLWL